MADLLQIIRDDYNRFPENQTYEIYANDVFFKDPMTEFRGLDRYKKMIQFITTWFQEPKLELHHIERNSVQDSVQSPEHNGTQALDRTPDPRAMERIETRWTLSWTTPLPWRPHISVSGWSEMLLNSESKVFSHIDYWDCSRWHVLQQHLPWHS